MRKDFKRNRRTHTKASQEQDLTQSFCDCKLSESSTSSGEKSEWMKEENKLSWFAVQIDCQSSSERSSWMLC